MPARQLGRQSPREKPCCWPTAVACCRFPPSPSSLAAGSLTSSPALCAQPCRRGRAVPQVPHLCGHRAGLCAARAAVGVPYRAAGVPAAVASQRCKRSSTAAAAQQHAVAAATARWGSGQGSRSRHWARIQRPPLLAAAAPADMVGTWLRLGSQQGAGRLACCRAAIAAAGVAPAAVLYDCYCFNLVFQLVFPAFENSFFSF